MNYLISFAFFIPALTCLVYFLAGKKKIVLYIIPGVYFVAGAICRLDPKLYASEEGNFLFYILLCILFLFVFDYYYKRNKGFTLVSAFALFAHILFNLGLLFMGIVLFKYYNQ